MIQTVIPNPQSLPAAGRRNRNLKCIVRIGSFTEKSNLLGKEYFSYLFTSSLYPMDGRFVQDLSSIPLEF
jgi:hypothetical protein